MAKKKTTAKQLQMSFNLPAKTKNTSRDAFKKATEKTKSYGQKAAENVSKSKSTSTAVAKPGNNYPATQTKNASTVSKAKLLSSGKSTALAKAGKIAQQAPKYTDFVEVGKKASKGKDIKGKAMLAVYGTAAAIAAASSGVFDKKKETGIKNAAKTLTKKPDATKAETKQSTKPKTDSKKAIPASDSRYKNMTPAERNANTLKNVKESLAGPQKKPDTKKPVTVNNAKGKTTYDPKARTVTTYNSKGKTVEDKKEGSTTNYNSKGATTTYKDSPAGYSIVKNKKGKIDTNSDGSGNIKNKKGKTGFNPDGTKSYTKNSKGATYYNNDGTIRRVDNKKGTTYYDKQGKAIVSSNNTTIEQKAKDVMSGKYGSGADRKKALGADYDKVQAIINKQSATSKAKTAPAKTVAAPEKMEIKKAGPIAYTGPKELAGVKPKSEDVDKSIDAAMKGIAKSKIMKKGGQVLPKAQYGKIVKTAANYIKPAMGAAKSATKSAKIGVKQLSDKYKKVKADNYNKKTAHLRRSEDWEKFNAAESDKKLQRTLIGIAGGSTALALYPNKKKSKKK